VSPEEEIKDPFVLEFLGLGAGLKRSEAAALDLAHYDPTACELKVRGKGDKERLVPLANGVTAALEDWLSIRGASAGQLLCPVRKGAGWNYAG
jgi:site-specific recombinase XerC